MAAARALVLLSLLAVSASGLREASQRHRQRAQTEAASTPKYKTGEFMQYQVLEGPDAGSWVKCSITGVGDLPDTYNVYVYGADPHRRNVKNIPVEVMRSQAEQDVKERAIEEARRIAKEREDARRAAQELAERLAREAEEARRAAQAAAEEKARVQEEARRFAEEEARRIAEEAEAKRRAEEEARITAEREAREKAERDEKARQRKIRLKAKWEQVKAAKKAAEEKAVEDEAKRLEEETAARLARGERLTNAPRPLKDPENIKVVVKFEGKPDVSLKVKRNLRLRALMSVAAEKMNVELQDVRFVIGKRVFSPEETAERFGRNDKAVIKMERLSPREKVSSLRLMSEHFGTKSFETGDFVEANVTDGQGSVLTVPFTVRSRGSAPDSFDVHLMFPTGGRQDFPSFPARFLHKVRGRDYASAVKTFRESPELATRAAKLMARYLPVGQSAEGIAEAPQASAEAPHSATNAFEVGNMVELRLQDGTVMPATVTSVTVGVAGEPSNYDLHAVFAPSSELRNLRDLHSVPEGRLRRTLARPYVEAVKQLKKDPTEAQRVLELAAKELNDA